MLFFFRIWRFFALLLTVELLNLANSLGLIADEIVQRGAPKSWLHIEPHFWGEDDFIQIFAPFNIDDDKNGGNVDVVVVFSH